jgi:hypothetical protein
MAQRLNIKLLIIDRSINQVVPGSLSNIRINEGDDVVALIKKVKEAQQTTLKNVKLLELAVWKLVTPVPYEKANTVCRGIFPKLDGSAVLSRDANAPRCVKLDPWFTFRRDQDNWPSNHLCLLIDAPVSKLLLS